ncbi:class I adenylate-forming enzyme family protein [Ferrimicrobium sp.]|uniref:class I adenylate-forming enzyme family protein n=1 Tax=Ferrimicrobium sp. TaxID=2926050 RepID=UPI00261BEEB6|nr:class I adenylate-forming enzyme family protein [Ferrimicrobium sp.]
MEREVSAEAFSDSQLTIDGLLRERALAQPEALFLADGNRRATFAQFDDLVSQVAMGLQRRGLQPGDRVAVAAPNSLEWLAFLFAASRARLIVVTLNPRYRSAELEYMLNQSGARLLLCATQAGGFDFVDFLAKFRHHVPGVRDYVFLGDDGFPSSLHFEDLLEHGKVGMPSGDPMEPRVILYTSGTTGQPKGAVLTSKSLLASATAQVARLRWHDADSIVGHLPLNHVGGLTCTVLSMLAAGGTIYSLPDFSPQAALDLISRQHITVLMGVPTMWVMMMNLLTSKPVDTSSVRQLIAGGSTLDPTLVQRVSAAFPSGRIVNLYGLSESSGAAVISADDDDLSVVSRSIGVPLLGVRARVVGGDQEEASLGNDGELQLQGPCVANGYWGLPAETAETFLENGWLATGDMVEASADGHLVLLGRRKEMFIQGGFNVYPAEVEGVLSAHPDVAMATGIGVADPVYGEIGYYYVVPTPGSHPEPEVLLAWCEERLADYKVPRRIVVTTEVPLTPAGKVAKVALRDWARERP